MDKKTKLFWALAKCGAAVKECIEADRIGEQDFGKICISDRTAIMIYSAYEDLKEQGMLKK